MTAPFAAKLAGTEPAPNPIYALAEGYGIAAGRAHAHIDYAIYLLDSGRAEQARAKLDEALGILGDAGGWKPLWTVPPASPEGQHSTTDEAGRGKGGV